MSPIDPRDVRDKRISFRPASPEQKTAHHRSGTERRRPRIHLDHGTSS